MIGAPSSAMVAATCADSRNGGLPTGMWLLTSAVNKPSSASSIAAAVSSDCEKKKLVSIVKKLRKKMTKASRCARSSSVFNVSNTTISVTPASRPSRVRCVINVAPTVSTSNAKTHHREGKARAVQASQPRQNSTATANRLHQTGKLLICGATTQPITTSKNKVSRASRGR